MSFKDHFSGMAGLYAHVRPTYPDELFQWLADNCSGHDLVWDCATGNGQAAKALANYFTRVHATDASASQIAQAIPDPRINYQVAEAGNSGLPAGSADLVTVATALHWLPLEAFYKEVDRVLKPGGLFAAWTYFYLNISPEVDAVIYRLINEILEDSYAPEIAYVRNGYADIAVPYPIIEVPTFEIITHWKMDQVLAFLSSWSAVKTFKERYCHDPLWQIHDAFQTAWGDPEQIRDVRFPLAMIACRKI